MRHRDETSHDASMLNPRATPRGSAGWHGVPRDLGPVSTTATLRCGRHTREGLAVPGTTATA
jgi:hypothetical protein